MKEFARRISGTSSTAATAKGWRRLGGALGGQMCPFPAGHSLVLPEVPVRFPDLGYRACLDSFLWEHQVLASQSPVSSGLGAPSGFQESPLLSGLCKGNQAGPRHLPTPSWLVSEGASGFCSRKRWPLRRDRGGRGLHPVPGIGGHREGKPAVLGLGHGEKLFSSESDRLAVLLVFVHPEPSGPADGALSRAGALRAPVPVGPGVCTP